MDVLVGGGRGEGAGGEVRLEAVQPAEHPGELLLREQARRAQDPGMGP